MRTLGLALLISVLLVWQATVRAENAVVLKAHSYQVLRDGYPMPKRILPVGTIVKVLATHGKKANIATSSGDTVSIPLTALRMLHDPASTPLPAQIATGPLVAVIPPPPALLPPPSPSPSPAGGTRPVVADAGSAHSGETGRQPVPVRCSHVLKNGQQCSRLTSSPNGLCWQHGGD